MKAITVANYMLYIMSDAFDDLTNEKINMLLYFAQGHYISRYGKALFDDKIEAWEHGPVVPEVYAAYKEYGDKPILGYDSKAISEISPEAEAVLFGVARTYGRYTASALRNITHVVGSSWNQAHTEIPLSVIRDYFADCNDLNIVRKAFKESDFIGYRDADGVLVLPKDWDDVQTVG